MSAATTTTEWADLAAALKASHAEQLEAGIARPVGLFVFEFLVIDGDAGNFGPISGPYVSPIASDCSVEIDLAGAAIATEWCWDAVDVANEALTAFGVELDWHGCVSVADDDVVGDGDNATAVVQPWIVFPTVAE